MSNQLSEVEATKLFNSVSGNLGDPNKLNEILEASISAEAAAEPAAEPEIVPTKEVPVSQEPAAAVGGEDEKPDPTEGVSEPVPKARGEDEVEALRQKLRLMEHRIKSDDGRVSAFQRKAAELEAKLAELNKNAKPPSAAVAPESPEKDEDLELLKKADPALYRILMKREESLRKENESLRNELKLELAPVRQTYEKANAAQEVNRLKELVPNISEVANSEAFLTYRDHVAPAVVKQLLSSKSADDVVQGLQVYSAWVQANVLSNKPATQPQAVPNATATTGNAVVAERERKLSTSVNVASPSSSPTRRELTEAELFEQHFSETLKRNEIKR